MSLLLAIDLLNDGHTGDLVPVLPKAGPQVLQEAPVDVIDDLHVAGQQPLHQADRPLLQGLWEHCVIGECKNLHNATSVTRKATIIIQKQRIMDSAEYPH